MATGEQGRLDKKAKKYGVLGVVGNAWVQAKERVKNLLMPREPSKITGQKEQRIRQQLRELRKLPPKTEGPGLDEHLTNLIRDLSK